MARARCAWLVVALAGAQSPDLLFNPQRQRMREPIHVKEDLHPIMCDVCELVAFSVFFDTQEKRKEKPIVTEVKVPGKKVKKSSFSEDDIIQTISDVCDRKRKAGEWMWTVDLTQRISGVKGSRFWNEPSDAEKEAMKTRGARFLFVERRDDVRKWDRETATVKKSCDLIFEEEIEDVDQFALALWHNEIENPEQARELLCHHLTDRCNYETRIPIDAILGDAKRVDYEFVKVDHRVVEAEQIQQNMADGGNPMAMHTPDEMEEILLEDMEERGMTDSEIEDYVSEEEDKYDQVMGTNIHQERKRKREKQKRVINKDGTVSSSRINRAQPIKYQEDELGAPPEY